jgi:hypothetical protein
MWKEEAMRRAERDESQHITAETDKRDAVYERIYENYGSDLAGFFRDVYKEVALRRQKSERCADETHAAATVQ